MPRRCHVNASIVRPSLCAVPSLVAPLPKLRLTRRACQTYQARRTSLLLLLLPLRGLLQLRQIAFALARHGTTRCAACVLSLSRHNPKHYNMHHQHNQQQRGQQQRGQQQRGKQQQRRQQQAKHAHVIHLISPRSAQAEDELRL